MDISKLTKRQRVAILSFRNFLRPTYVQWMPKTMESMMLIGLTEATIYATGKTAFRLTDAGREVLAKIIEEERGGKA